MELIVERVSFLNSLGMVQGIVERRNTVPILGHVLLKVEAATLKLAATDLEVGIRTELSCDQGGQDGEGQLTLSARKLFEVVREAEGDKVTLKTLDNDWIELKCGRARFKMMGLDPRSFPAMPEASSGGGRNTGVGTLKLDARVLAEMIDHTIFSVSPDEARYNLSGVYIDCPEPGKVRMVATDGHRLSLIDREANEFKMEGGAIIPRKGLAELRKLLDQAGDAAAELVLDGQLARCSRGSTEVSMRLVEGEFPDYRGVIPKSSRYQIAVGRETLLNTIKRAAIFSNERFHGVKLSFAAGTLTVSSTSPEMGEASETVDVNFQGEEFSVGFNAAYIQQVLNVLAAGDVMLGLSDDVSPGVITSEADSLFQYVVMPMRL
jgi:DNA polymerase-3 subunit beta